jgi:hypothetical protein
LARCSSRLASLCLDNSLFTEKLIITFQAHAIWGHIYLSTDTAKMFQKKGNPANSFFRVQTLLPQ